MNLKANTLMEQKVDCPHNFYCKSSVIFYYKNKKVSFMSKQKTNKRYDIEYLKNH